jgi:nucleotide-binding universal stress UspA family protein
MGAILLAYDGSEAAERALVVAIEEAQRRAAELLILGVAPLVLPPVEQVGSETVDPTPAVQEMADKLADAERQAHGGGVRVRTVEALGEPIDTIIRFARESPVDLVVLGSGHRPDARVRARFGEVADAVTRELRCDVVVVA